MTKTQQDEVRLHEERLERLRACEQNAVNEPLVLAAVERARRNALCEASGHRQADSSVAQALWQSEQRKKAMAEQLQAELEARTREREAKDKVTADAMRQLEVRLGELRQQEAALALLSHQQAEAERAKQRRIEMENLSHGFTYRELGTGLPGGGGDRCRRNRADLLLAVSRLGSPLPPDVEASWRRWQRRFDDEGIRRHGRLWAPAFRERMLPLVTALMAGDADAFLRWYRRISHKWRLDRHDFLVPAASGRAAASSSGDPAGPSPL